MFGEKLHYLGLLANVNSSIVNLELESGLEIRSMDLDKCLKLLCQIENLEPCNYSIIGDILNQNKCINYNEYKIYFIYKSLPIDKHFLENEELEYLSSLMSLLRLFKSGNICIPLQYHYYSDGSFSNRIRTNEYISREQYNLKDSELQMLLKYIRETKLLFEKPFL